MVERNKFENIIDYSIDEYGGKVFKTDRGKPYLEWTK